MTPFDAGAGMSGYTGRVGFWITGNDAVRVQDGRGLVLGAQFGTVWITQAGSSKDVFIADGESFLIEHDGRTLVSLGGPETAAVVTLMPSVHANRSAMNGSVLATSVESRRAHRGAQSSDTGDDPRDRLLARLHWDGVRGAV
ncbi:MAG: DUF2917 domain-containing protein [Betaproteobacteria bacterium]